MKRDFGPYHRLVYRYHTDLLEIYHNACDNWCTEKARINELLQIIPLQYRIQSLVFKKEDRANLQKTMLQVLKSGHWIGLRSCYLDQPLGKAPWIMAMKSEKALRLFFAKKQPCEKRLWLGTPNHYDEWLSDPHLKEIIVMYNPQRLCPRYKKEHFVARIETFEKELRVESKLFTDQTRDMEGSVHRKELIIIKMPLKDYLLFEKKPLIVSFGRSYFHKNLPYRTLEKIKMGLEMTNGCFGEFSLRNDRYTSLIDQRIAKITSQIIKIIFDEWCEAPYNLFYRLQALREFGLGTLEIQGRIENDQVKYFLVYGLRGIGEISQKLQAML